MPAVNIASPTPRMRIAVVGTGIAGLSAAWLLAQNHDVTVFEAGRYAGGHSNTVEITTDDGPVAVDTGFIVSNPATYPNLTALFAHLDVETYASEMTFGVSLGNGDLEYAGTDLGSLFAQKANLFRPRFWSMLRDLRRFYALASASSDELSDVTLGAYLDQHGIGDAFREDHLYPMAGAIWSIPAGSAADYPARAFIRFCQNHGLLRYSGRPIWRTVTGGSRTYVAKMLASLPDVRLQTPVIAIRRLDDGGDGNRTRATHGREIEITYTSRTDQSGTAEPRLPFMSLSTGGSVTDASQGLPSEARTEYFDHVVIGAHGDQALRLLDDADADERRLLGCFRYSRNQTFLHRDPSLMPKRRAVWSSWNYLSPTRDHRGAPVSVTYWMNRLQALPTTTNIFVTLNPPTAPRDDLVWQRIVYEHPIFDAPTIAAQSALWSLQGRRRTWFCGAWFGAGFHEDGLQAGLAVAEQLGGAVRPWRVANESGRIHVGPVPVGRGQVL